MVSVINWKQQGKFLLVFIVLGGQLDIVQSFSYPEEKVEEQVPTWPTIMTFHETKTNAMLGETLLRRIYTRIEHIETLIRLETSQIYDQLKNEIQKNFRKCDRQRRKAENLRMPNTTDSKGNKHQKRDKRRRKDKKSMPEGENHQYQNHHFKNLG